MYSIADFKPLLRDYRSVAAPFEPWQIGWIIMILNLIKILSLKICPTTFQPFLHIRIGVPIISPSESKYAVKSQRIAGSNPFKMSFGYLEWEPY
jgi:hypothetical protein